MGSQHDDRNDSGETSHIVPIRSRGIEDVLTRANLIRDLAAGDTSQTDLAARYGVTQSAISKFAGRHQLAIIDARGHITEEGAGLWIASRRARLAEIQRVAEDVNAEVDRAISDGTPLDAGVLRVKLTALRNAAEELGQLKDTGGVQTLRIEIPGIDMTKLT
jgi:predicted transcriptional regulator